jgi:hypothetical protein
VYWSASFCYKKERIEKKNNLVVRLRSCSPEKIFKSPFHEISSQIKQNTWWHELLKSFLFFNHISLPGILFLLQKFWKILARLSTYYVISWHRIYLIVITLLFFIWNIVSQLRLKKKNKNLILHSRSISILYIFCHCAVNTHVHYTQRRKIISRDSDYSCFFCSFQEGTTTTKFPVNI